MNVVFVWTGIAGYMADCWRALAKRTNLKILISEFECAERDYNANQVLRDLDCEVIDSDARGDAERVRAVAALRDFKPDLILVVGWHDRLCRMVAEADALRDVPKVVVFDLPFAWTPRKIAAKLVLFRYLRRFKAAYVCGRRAARYARWLGFKRVETGLFSFDAARIGAVRGDGERSGGFVFVGRYAVEKRLDILAAAYREYRKLVDDPWPLDCYGMGPEARWLVGEGVRDCGFVQPERLPQTLARYRAFLMASGFEPWCVAIGEACAAGLPVVCTDACGAGDELIRDGENGFVVPAGDAAAMAAAMVAIHRKSDAERGAMGAKGREMVRPYSCEAWAERTLGICREVAK